MSTTLDQLRDCETLQPLEDIINELKTTHSWLWHPHFKVGPNQGYDGYTRMFGACAGFSYHLRAYNVLHEVAHAIEMTLLPQEDWHERILLDDFGMQILSYQDVMGQRIFEPMTMQPSKRECRVGGIQLRLLEAGGYDISDFVEKYVVTLKYMADSHMGGSCPLNTPDPAKYNDKQKQWVAVRTKAVMAAYEAFTLDDIQSRWNLVMDRLKTA
jgi:hypothetical protein